MSAIARTRLTLGVVARHLPQIVLAVAALALLAYLGGVVEGRLRENAPAADWFEYREVLYVRTADDRLLMLSEAAWHEPVGETRWFDVLRCERPGESEEVSARWPIYTDQRIVTGSKEPTDGFVFASWDYTAGHPTDGRRCAMISTITVEVETGLWKSQRIVSPPFTPGR